jgi:hypothetical protein
MEMRRTMQSSFDEVEVFCNIRGICVGVVGFLFSFLWVSGSRLLGMELACMIRNH